eukprot:TRINITY_DN12253_c0_g1_i1.p1 TRINITY_DN12253_c0_g1~~TRINITY_DN12253_c0_g1_i1.p1  ORF type:complete len:279 (+),score=52.53 TRINITY_DN12253_c0_g1_i1:112-948(+)
MAKVLSLLSLILSLLCGSVFGQSLTAVPHVWSPTVFAAFAVNPLELRPYIDPRFTINTFNGKAYILFILTNVSTPSTSIPGSAPFFDDFGIATYITYNGVASIESLYYLFGDLPAALVCSPFSFQPYGCHYSSAMSLTRDDTNKRFTFYAKTQDNLPLQATINTSVTWNPSQSVSYNDGTTLGGFLLNTGVHSIYTQSLYRNGITLPLLAPLLVIARGGQDGYAYEGGVYNCTYDSFSSSFISRVIGTFPSITENTPSFCAYSTRRTADVTAANIIGI